MYSVGCKKDIQVFKNLSSCNYLRSYNNRVEKKNEGKGLFSLAKSSASVKWCSSTEAKGTSHKFMPIETLAHDF